jgi:hypothetical protein
VLGVSYDVNNHQLGLSYDANGNQSADAQGVTLYNWNVENRLVAATSNGWPYPGTSYAYDPWGRRVMKAVNPDPNNYNGQYWNGRWEFYFYSITGQKLMTLGCNYSDGINGYVNWGGVSCSVTGNNLYFGTNPETKCH